jgi:hypothetical protein
MKSPKCDTAASTIETLEERRLMTTWIPNDMVDLGQHFPGHGYVTKLFLNFDGGTVDTPQSGIKRVISPYVPPAGVDLVQAIQDIIYRTTEIFAPFNVRVQIMRGAGNFDDRDNSTTVFVGDNDNNTIGGVNNAYDMTPFSSMDYPGEIKGYSHAPNRDVYDLAFVDPVYQFAPGQPLETLDAVDVARMISHEAGHTFGLAHVLSNPAQDMMSYNSSNVAFMNQSFAITNLNNDGTTTAPDPRLDVKVWAVDEHNQSVVQTITSQNSFGYLRAQLGKRDIITDPYVASLAHKTAVSPDYYNTLPAPTVITPASRVTQTLSNLGEYDVYTLNNPVSARQALFAPQPTRISLAVGLPVFDPQMMLYGADGSRLLKAVRGTALDYTLANNGSYKLVISGYLGDFAGQYTISMSKIGGEATAGGTATSAFASTAAPTTGSTSTTTSGGATLFSTTLVSPLGKQSEAALLA